MAWICLVVAGGFEIGWAMALKFANGLSRPLPLIGSLLCMAASMGFLGLALKTLPIGTAYAVWTGIGSVGTLVLGVLLLGEAAKPMRLICISLIILGICGLRIFE